MFTTRHTTTDELLDIADCHLVCFPHSLATRLGKKYVQKSLEWFLVNPNRFLFHVMLDGKVAGYCGGFVPAKAGDGSSSGMLQHAFKEAIKGIATRPFLLLHSEVRQYYPFLVMNVKRKLTGKAKPFKPEDATKPFKKFVGLVVIGVHPNHRGSGLAQQLMATFEEKVREFKQNELVLSVKKDNGRAIKAYENYGWKIKEEHLKTYVMNKYI